MRLFAGQARPAILLRQRFCRLRDLTRLERLWEVRGRQSILSEALALNLTFLISDFSLNFSCSVLSTAASIIIESAGPSSRASTNRSRWQVKARAKRYSGQRGPSVLGTVALDLPFSFMSSETI